MIFSHFLRKPWFARRYFKFKHQVIDRYRKSPVLVYQMGKVGSAAVHKSLTSYRLGRSIYHIHNLNKEQAKEELARHIEMSGSSRSYDYLWHSLFLCDLVRKPSSEKWPIITLVREPVKRNVSAFFQALDRINPELYQRGIKGNIEVDKLLDYFLNSFKQHSVPEIWFDRQLKNVFDVDVYSNPFPREKGYCIYESETAKVLLIRLENLEQCAGKAFNEFLGIQNFVLLTANIGENKAYKKMYKAFLAEAKLPDSYLKKIYNSKFTQHFYSKDEINLF